MGPSTSASSRPAAPDLPYGGVPPQPNYPAPQPSSFKPQAPPVQSFQQAPVAPSGMPVRNVLAPAQLFVPEEGRAIKLPEASQVVIGRIDSMSSYTPDIDLTPYGAFENGVGRRHLQLSVQSGQVIAEDLGSTNGSFINGRKLSPHSPHQLRNGDELRLGTLVMRLQL
ncbi:MAG: FHA domain-containing protein [Chloroflexales bacterium]|nr:FHA domain-containing protein [Chloroflexales bacterium]